MQPNQMWHSQGIVFNFLEGAHTLPIPTSMGRERDTPHCPYLRWTPTDNAGSATEYNVNYTMCRLFNKQVFKYNNVFCFFFFYFLCLSLFVSLSVFLVASFDGLRPLLVTSHCSLRSLANKLGSFVRSKRVELTIWM